MADEYIRRDAAMKAVASQYGACRSPAQNRMIDEIRNKIRRMPAADVAEVVNGEWLRSDDDWDSLTTIQCSSCGEEWCFETDDDVSLLNYKYCPNCGARMDGGEDRAVS
jgi:hypothetical protein